MSGAATNAQIASFLTALRMKGETVEELIGFAQVMRQKVVRVGRRRGRGLRHGHGSRDAPGHVWHRRRRLGDIQRLDRHRVRRRRGGDEGGQARQPLDVGAGGASLCGSADVVEALGVSLELSAAQVSRCIDEVGIGFLYAPLLHTAMKHVMPARREIGIRTVFNLLGPLTNPAGANVQVIGVAAADLTDKLARVLAELGTLRAFVVHGADGLDEISTPARAMSPRCTRAWCGARSCGPRTSASPARRSRPAGRGPRGERRDHPRDPGRRARGPSRHRVDQRGGGARGGWAGAGPQGGRRDRRAVHRLRCAAAGRPDRSRSLSPAEGRRPRRWPPLGACGGHFRAPLADRARCTLGGAAWREPLPAPADGRGIDPASGPRYTYPVGRRICLPDRGVRSRRRRSSRTVSTRGGRP